MSTTFPNATLKHLTMRKQSEIGMKSSLLITSNSNRLILFLFFFLVAALGIFVVPHSSNAATFMDKTKVYNRISSNRYCTGLIGIVGTIERGDALKFEQLIGKIKEKCSRFGLVQIVFHSKGGDVNEAIFIGNLIRNYELWTEVSPSYECFSACVLAFSGGVYRAAFGKIGIHRPFFSNLDANLTVSAIKEKRDETTQTMRLFLKNMDINENLVDAMMAIPPEKMKILSYTEISQFRLDGIDPSYEEKQIAELAKLYGSNSAVIRQRKMVADNCKDNFECREAAFWGITVKEYNSRLLNISKLCNEYDSGSDNSCKIQVMNGTRK